MKSHTADSKTDTTSMYKQGLSLGKWALSVLFILCSNFDTIKGLSMTKYCNLEDLSNPDCSGLIDIVERDVLSQSPNCSSKYWRLKIKVKKRPGGKFCMDMFYNITCLTASEKQIEKLNKEFCELAGNANNIVFQEKIPVIQQYIPTGDPIEVGNKAETVRLSPESEAKHLAFSAVKPLRRTAIEASPEENTNAYNDFFLSPDINIMLISLTDERGFNINETVAFTVNTENDSAIIDLPATQHFTIITKICMFYDIISSQWTDRSCSTINKENFTECKCDHNSAFAVVFATRNITLPQAVTTASIIMESTSILFLMVTAVLLCIYRKRMRNFDRVVVQINLCLALLLTHLFFVLSTLALTYSGLCHFMAIATHFFLVATAMLMVMEGILMLVKVLYPHALSGIRTRKKRIAGIIIAWVVPLIYAVICGAAGIASGGYLPKLEPRLSFDKCWIAPEHGRYVVLMPIVLALGINSLVAIRLGVLVWSMSRSAEHFKPSNLRDQNRASHAGKAFRAVFIMMPILGIPWILGLLVNIKPMEVIFSSIHVIVNGLQGVVLFIHYALCNKEMRGALKQMWTSSVSALPTVHFVSTGNTFVPSSVDKTSKSRSDSQAGLND